MPGGTGWHQSQHLGSIERWSLEAPPEPLATRFPVEIELQVGAADNAAHNASIRASETGC